MNVDGCQACAGQALALEKHDHDWFPGNSFDNQTIKNSHGTGTTPTIENKLENTDKLNRSQVEYPIELVMTDMKAVLDYKTSVPQKRKHLQIIFGSNKSCFY